MMNSVGRGFPMHTDSVPPFDLTLDICIDHEGPDSRPISFVRNNKAGKKFGVGIDTLELKVGQAVLFKGSVIPHFGGDLPEGNMHNSTLLTKSYFDIISFTIDLDLCYRLRRLLYCCMLID